MKALPHISFLQVFWSTLRWLISLRFRLYTTELHIYLDERDNRTADMSGSVSDGFGEESCLLDFPTRDKKTVLHVRRRRWTMPDGTTMSVDLDRKIQLKHPGTRYSKDLALFLKKADGQ